MEFLGVGPLELIFILIIALIVLGPNDMVKAGRTLGRLMRRMVTNPNWRILQETSREIRYLPNRLMREAGLEDLQKEIPTPQQISRDLELDQVQSGMQDLQKDLSSWTTPPTIGASQPTVDPESPVPSAPESTPPSEQT